MFWQLREPRRQLLLKRISRVAKDLKLFCFAAHELRRIGDAPMNAPGTTWKDRTGLGHFVAHGNYIGEKSVGELAEVLRAVMADVDAAFTHDLNGKRVNG